MAQHCMDKWDKLKVDIEQDLAVGAESANNERSLNTILLNKEISYKDKARVILLYILRKGPQTIDWLDTMMNVHAEIPQDEQVMVKNLHQLGCEIISATGTKGEIF